MLHVLMFPWGTRATHHHHTFEPGGAPRDGGPHGGHAQLTTTTHLSPVVLRVIEGPHGGHAPLTTTTHLSPVVLRVIGGPHGGHAPLSTTTHLSPVVLHVMEVPMEGACHSPHAPRSAARHMKAIGGSHITRRPPPHHASTRWLRSLHWYLEVAACLFVSC